MDLSLSSGSATVTALSDGNASIDLSNEGGYIGGLGKPAIHNAAQNFVRTAAEFQADMKAATEFPLPEPSGCSHPYRSGPYPRGGAKLR
jgi:hypothetical protein